MSEKAELYYTVIKKRVHNSVVNGDRQCLFRRIWKQLQMFVWKETDVTKCIFHCFIHSGTY